MSLLDINSEVGKFHGLLTDDNKIINTFENGEMARALRSYSSEDYLEKKIIDFLSWFNGPYHLTFSNCSYGNEEKFIYLLTLLKRSALMALKELKGNLNKKKYNFKCTQCKETVIVKPHRDFWKSLQEHDHFESIYVDSLKNDYITLPSEQLDENSDREIINESISLVVQNTSIDDQGSNEENINSFRFNFHIEYDENIASLIYPPNLMSAIEVYEQVKHYTIQRIGPSKVFCLLCQCPINCLKVNKNSILNHVLGQKHFKLCQDQPTVQLLDSYHSFWLQQDPSIQSHQVYIKPDKKRYFRCIICAKVVDINSVFKHIMADEHKYKVIYLYETKKEEFYLMDYQLSCYGIIKEEKQSGESPLETSNVKRKPEIVRKRNKTVDSPSDTHNVIRSIQRPESTNILDLIPNRMQSQVANFTISEDGKTIYCTLCKCNVPCKLKSIKEHILMSSRHFNSKNKFKYYCEICDSWCKSEFEWSKHNFNGRRHSIMPDARKAKVTEYECITCNMVIFGDDLSVSRHMPKNRRFYKGDKVNRLPETVKVFFKSKETIIENATKLLRECEDTLIASNTAVCCKDLQDVLTEQFKNCELCPFGSRISGLGTTESDLDIFVDTGNLYHGLYNQEPKDQVILIRQVLKLLTKNKNFSNLTQVLTARTPILRLHHLPTDIDCDLSFKHGLSVENTKFLKYCMEIQPITKSLILLIKKWWVSVAIEYITSYALAILVVFFLQTKGFLLSIEKLREIQGLGQIIGGWKTIAYNSSLEETKKHFQECTLPLDALLKEFFEYYSKFNFDKHVICPLLGRVLEKTLFSENRGKDLPKELEDYILQLNDIHGEEFKITPFICVQDPFDLCHNLTKGAQEATLKKIIDMSRLTINLLNFDSR